MRLAPLSLEGNEFIASDGHHIYYKVWESEVNPIAIVLMFHGLGNVIINISY